MNLFLHHTLILLSSCNYYFDHFMFVRTREDTVRCIVTSLTDENSTELAEVTGNMCIYLLQVVSYLKFAFMFTRNAEFCLNVMNLKTARLSFMYKLSHNLMDFSVEAHLKPNNERRTRGSHASKFVVPVSRVKKDIFKFSFFP